MFAFWGSGFVIQAASLRQLHTKVGRSEIRTQVGNRNIFAFEMFVQFRILTGAQDRVFQINSAIHCHLSYRHYLALLLPKQCLSWNPLKHTDRAQYDLSAPFVVDHFAQKWSNKGRDEKITQKTKKSPISWPSKIIFFRVGCGGIVFLKRVLDERIEEHLVLTGWCSYTVEIVKTLFRACQEHRFEPRTSYYCDQTAKGQLA